MYGIFGALTTVINLVVYKLLVDTGINYMAATTISFSFAIAFAFFTNRKWVFESNTNGFQKVCCECFKFLLARLGTYILELLLLILMIEALSLGKFVSKAVATSVIIILNYVLSKLLVFTTVDNQTEG
jgi:putative flippase GtrA